MFLLKNATIYTMDKDIIRKGSILIEDGLIKKIGKNIEREDAEIIDVEGKFITPGLIDAHCHLGLFEDGIGFEGSDANELTDPITPHLRAIDAINPMDKTFDEALEGGVTTVSTGPGSGNVIGGQFAIIKTHGDNIDEMIIKEPHAMKCAFGENPKRVYNEKSKSPSTRMATAAKLREALYQAINYKKSKEKENDKFDIKMEALLPVINQEMPLKAHAHRADDILTAIRIAKEFNLDLTLDHCTEGHLIKKYLKKENYPVIVGPSLSHRSKFELKNLTFETPGILNKEGIKVAIMTDSPVIPLQYLNICAALAHKSGMDKYEALKAVTLYPAEILKIDDKLGSITEGKEADIVVWDKHPLDIQANTEKIFIKGELIKK